MLPAGNHEVSARSEVDTTSRRNRNLDARARNPEGLPWEFMSTTPPPPPGSPPPPPASPDPGRNPNFGGAPSSGIVGVGPGGRTIAPAWKRIVARFLDSIIVNIFIGYVVIELVAGEDSTTFTTGEGDGGGLLAASLIVLAIAFVWDAVATKMIGGTPMKRAFGMRVVQAESGAEVEWRHAVIRWATFAIWTVIPFLSVIVPLILVVVSLVFMFTKPLRQAVWDRTAKTVVIDG